MEQRRKKWNITIDHWFFFSQYAGAVLLVLGYARLPLQTRLLPGVTGNRAFLLLLPAALLALAYGLDRLYLKALKKDLFEKKQGVKNAALHVRTLEALAAPAMLLLDAGALLWFFLSMKSSGMLEGDEVTRRSLALAFGITLWIYGRVLPKIPYGSIWGIRTSAAMKSVTEWGRIHLNGVPVLCIAGAAALLCGAFLPANAALVFAVLAFAAAFLIVFQKK